MSAALKRKISTGKAKISVLGLGYVGLPLAVNFAKAGFSVLGLDKDTDRVQRILRKESYILDVSARDLARVVNRKTFTASQDFSLISQMDVIIICVPTPLKRKYTPDISYITGAIREIARYVKKDTLLVLESTTYPGTTSELILPEIEKSGFKVGKEIFLAFSPERIDPGNPKYDVTRIPKVVGGVDPVSGALTKRLYEKIIKQIHLVSTAKAAEMTKLLENSFRIINIGWINEVAMMCHELGIDIWEVIAAADTKPFGFMPFYPGLGVGGHCIPDDPLYLYWKAKQYGFNSKFIKLSADTNLQMTGYAVQRVAKLLRSRKKSLRQSRLLVVGVTYKKDVKDLRKSPPLELIELLKRKGAKVEYYDPIIPYLDIGKIKQKSIALKAEQIRKYDCVIIATDHTKINYKLIHKSAKLIFDVRNVYSGVRDKKVFKL